MSIDTTPETDALPVLDPDTLIRGLMAIVDPAEMPLDGDAGPASEFGAGYAAGGRHVRDRIRALLHPANEPGFLLTPAGAAVLDGHDNLRTMLREHGLG